MPSKAKVLIGACYRKRSGGRDVVKSGKVDIAFVENVDRTSLEGQHVQLRYIVHAGWRNKQAYQNRYSQIYLGVTFNPLLVERNVAQGYIVSDKSIVAESRAWIFFYKSSPKSFYP